MKIKLDENLPSRLATRLGSLGHEIRTVREEGMEGQLDTAIWQAAQQEARFLITQDMDFSDARRFAPGSHCGILLIRLRTPGRRALIQRIEDLFRQEEVSEWERCFVVATERKVRVRRPAKGRE
jgi:predicted nuclease of predicted toxin-antitoxin system